MGSVSSHKRLEDFRRLNEGPEILILPCAWDFVSARIFSQEGFPALGTTIDVVLAVAPLLEVTCRLRAGHTQLVVKVFTLQGERLLAQRSGLGAAGAGSERKVVARIGLDVSLPSTLRIVVQAMRPLRKGESADAPHQQDVVLADAVTRVEVDLR